MTRIVPVSALALMLLPCFATAQEKAVLPTPVVVASAPEAMKQEYVIKLTAKEVEGGRVINTREYMLHTRAGAGSKDAVSMRTGSRVPVAIGSYKSGDTANRRYTYVDVGINFDCAYIQLFGDKITMVVKAEISSYDQNVLEGTEPIIRQNRWEGSVTIPIGKTETIFSSDDVVSKRTLQVDMQVTPAR